MQELVAFKIKVDSNYSEVENFIKEYFAPESWFEDNVKEWCANIKFDPADSTISNDYEGKMYLFDYEEMFPSVIEELIVKLPNSEFSGESSYYCDDGCSYGPIHHFSYKDGKLELEVEEEEFDEF